MPRLGDHERRPRAHDLAALAQDHLEVPRIARPARRARARASDGSTSASRTTRPSTFETAFCATTTDVGVLEPAEPVAASWTRQPRSSPSSSSGMPSRRDHAHLGHAAAILNTSSASSRAASRSVISVSVTTSGTPAVARGVRMVDHERVDQTLVTGCDMCRSRPARHAREHTVERPLTARPPISGLTAMQRHAPRRECGADRPPRRGSGRSRRTGCSARSRSRRRASIASRRPERLARPSAPWYSTASTSSSCRRATNHSWNEKRARRRVDERPQRIVGRGKQHASSRPACPTSAAVTAESGCPSRSACVRTRCSPRSRSPSMNQSSPPQLPGRLEGAPGLARATPAALLVVEAGEGVEHRVEVG